MSTPETKFQDLIYEFDAFCKAKELSDDLKHKIHIYLERKYEKNYFNENAIRESTSTSLRKEIMMQTHAHLIKRVSLFKNIPLNLIAEIVECLQYEIYFPNDIIVEMNTISSEMFIISYGTAVIVSADGKQTRTKV
jgi:hypothetical protein